MTRDGVVRSMRSTKSATLKRSKVEPDEVVTFYRNALGECELVNARWPKTAAFSMELIGSTPHIRLRDNHIHIKVSNAQAVYRITERAPGIVAGELVYEEGP